MDIDTHREVFSVGAGIAGRTGTAQGEADGHRRDNPWKRNAAMRSIVAARHWGTYDEFLRGLAKASGMETPTERLVGWTGSQEANLQQGVERARRRRRADCEMKDGGRPGTQAEHAVDMDTGGPSWR